jgi:hypothetical protein
MQPNQLPILKPGPGEEVVFISRPGYYIIPKKQAARRPPSAKRKRKPARKIKGNPFMTSLQPWHVVALCISAACIALAVVFG